MSSDLVQVFVADALAMFNPTPARPSADVPSRADIRCASQRSIPCVGTATISGANRSSSRLGQRVYPLSSVDVKHA